MRPAAVRLLLFTALVAGAVAAAATFRRGEPNGRDPRIEWIATAHQMGPVGYRDPAGAISPDERWIAYSEGRFLRVRPLDGGPLVDFPPGAGQIRHIAWRPDGRVVLADGDTAAAGWARYDIGARARVPVFGSTQSLEGRLTDGSRATAMVRQLRQPSYAPDGASLAAVVNAASGPELWIVSSDGAPVRVARLAHPTEFPVWTPAGAVACISTIDGRRRLTLPCDGAPVRLDPDLDVYGPLAVSRDGSTAYAGMPNDRGTLDVWSIALRNGRAHRITAFAGDSYGASAASTGAVLFRVQSYRTAVAAVAADGGPSRPLATFRSETPSWDPSGRSLGITYGSWRRVVDDAKYPDIAQEAGIIDVDLDRPATSVSSVVQASVSEDQSLCWSPNGKWIAYHSHKDRSDDIWLRPAATPDGERRLSFLGRGAETGWPRWSPDGRWLLFDGASPSTRRSVMFVAGVDQESGEVTAPPREIATPGIEAEMSHAEWLPDSAGIVAVAKEGPGRHVIFATTRDGGPVRIVRRVETEHDAPGLAASPDGRDVAFVAPAPDGYFQIWRMSIEGGDARQLTTDRSHKTQPAWSPDGKLIAFTVWSYEAQFWRTLSAER